MNIRKLGEGSYFLNPGTTSPKRMMISQEQFDMVKSANGKPMKLGKETYIYDTKRRQVFRLLNTNQFGESRRIPCTIYDRPPKRGMTVVNARRRAILDALKNAPTDGEDK